MKRHCYRCGAILYPSGYLCPECFYLNRKVVDTTREGFYRIGRKFRLLRNSFRLWWDTSPRTRIPITAAVILLISNIIIGLSFGISLNQQKTQSSQIISSLENDTHTMNSTINQLNSYIEDNKCYISRYLGFYTNFNDNTTLKYLHLNLSCAIRQSYVDRKHNLKDYSIDEYEQFCNGEYLTSIAKTLKSVCGADATEEEIVQCLLSFVQDKGLWNGIKYDADPQSFEYPKYPIETLTDMGGDCEDQSILFTSLCESLGYESILVKYTGHMYAAVHLSNIPTHTTNHAHYFDQNSVRYYTCETTSYGWKIGDLPSESHEQSNTIIEVTI